MKGQHSEEAWEMARAAFETEGVSYEQCSMRSGIPRGTIRLRALDQGWTKPGGLKAGASREEIQAAAAVAQETNNLAHERRKGEMVEAFVETVFSLRDQLDKPFLKREVKSIGLGGGITENEVVDVWLPAPPPGEQQRLVTSMAILVDKIQLITGGATSRQENIVPDRDAALERVQQIRDELAERRAANEAGAAGPTEETG